MGICKFLIMLLFVSNSISSMSQKLYPSSQTMILMEKEKIDMLTKNGQITTRRNYNSRSHTYLNLRIEEVTDTAEDYFRPFSDDLGGVFGYCGDIVGGIVNLLQTDIHTTPHLHFLNKPQEKRYVLFYAQGWDLKGGKTQDSSKCYSKDLYFDGRDMILKLMEKHFDFKVQESKDSLEYLELNIKDTTKLFGRKTVPEGCLLSGGTSIDSIENSFNGSCASLLWISVYLEQKLNIYNDDATNTLGTYFDYKIPLELLTSYDKIPELNSYLEAYMGLTITKTKKLETVYTVKFLK